MKVEVAQVPCEGWDGFVRSHPEGELGHAAAWPGILNRAYGLEPICLTARDDAGAIAGVLSLASFRGLTGGRELVSLPYLDAGGVLATDREAREALIARALDETRRRGARALELRSLAPLEESEEAASALEPAHRVDLRLELEADEQAQWKALGAKVRNQTRKAEKEGLAIGEPPRSTALDAFYEPFCENMRDLGSPVHARRFFAEVLAGFGDAARLVNCHGEARSVGGLLAIDFAGTVTVPWASTLRAERRRCPNNLIYWEAIRWALERGASVLDFGRSPVDAGTYRFKKGWGARERPLIWTRLAPSGEAMPHEAVGDDPVLQRLSALWTRLPVGLTRVVGPRVRKRISA